MVSGLSWKSVRLPMLTVLKLHSCEGITSASMTAIAYSSMLEVRNYIIFLASPLYIASVFAIL